MYKYLIHKLLLKCVSLAFLLYNPVHGCYSVELEIFPVPFSFQLSLPDTFPYVLSQITPLLFHAVSFQIFINLYRLFCYFRQN